MPLFVLRACVIVVTAGYRHAAPSLIHYGFHACIVFAVFVLFLFLCSRWIFLDVPLVFPVELTHLVVKWSAVRNQSEIETSLKMRGMSPFLFVKLVQQRRTQNHAKPARRVRRSSGQPFTGTTRSVGVGGVGLALAILVGLVCFPIYFMSTIVHGLGREQWLTGNIWECSATPFFCQPDQYRYFLPTRPISQTLAQTPPPQLTTWSQ